MPKQYRELTVGGCVGFFVKEGSCEGRFEGAGLIVGYSDGSRENVGFAEGLSVGSEDLVGS